MNVDTSKWSGEGDVHAGPRRSSAAARCAIAFVRVEDAPASRSEADYNFISNEVFVAFATTVARGARPALRLPARTRERSPRSVMTSPGSKQALTAAPRSARPTIPTTACCSTSGPSASSRLSDAGLQAGRARARLRNRRHARAPVGSRPAPTSADRAWHRGQLLNRLRRTDTDRVQETVFRCRSVQRVKGLNESGSFPASGDRHDERRGAGDARRRQAVRRAADRPGRPRQPGPDPRCRQRHRQSAAADRSQRALDEFGAVQYELPPMAEFPGEHFTFVAARGGEDVWAEIRRRKIPRRRSVSRSSSSRSPRPESGRSETIAPAAIAAVVNPDLPAPRPLRPNELSPPSLEPQDEAVRREPGRRAEAPIDAGAMTFPAGTGAAPAASVDRGRRIADVNAGAGRTQTTSCPRRAAGSAPGSAQPPLRPLVTRCCRRSPRRRRSRRQCRKTSSGRTHADCLPRSDCPAVAQTVAAAAAGAELLSPPVRRRCSRSGAATPAGPVEVAGTSLVSGRARVSSPPPV